MRKTSARKLLLAFAVLVIVTLGVLIYLLISPASKKPLGSFVPISSASPAIQALATGKSQILTGPGEIALNLPDGNRKHVKAEEVGDEIKLQVYSDRPNTTRTGTIVQFQVTQLSQGATFSKGPDWFALLGPDGTVFYGRQHEWVNYFFSEDGTSGAASLKPAARATVFDAVDKSAGEK